MASFVAERPWPPVGGPRRDAAGERGTEAGECRPWRHDPRPSGRPAPRTVGCGTAERRHGAWPCFRSFCRLISTPSESPVSLAMSFSVSGTSDDIERGEATDRRMPERRATARKADGVRHIGRGRRERSGREMAKSRTYGLLLPGRKWPFAHPCTAASCRSRSRGLAAFGCAIALRGRVRAPARARSGISALPTVVTLHSRFGCV